MKVVVTEFQDFSFEPPQSLIYNTGISTYNNDGLPMILSEMVRVVGHELGHNWGSHHDPSLQQCDNFLMNEYAQDGSEGSHMVRKTLCCSRGLLHLDPPHCRGFPSAVAEALGKC